MLFTIVSIVVPIAVYLLVPRLIAEKDKKHRWLLALACLVFFISWYLPSPLVDGQQTQFTTHFVGGGIFSGLLWLYIKSSKSWRANWWLEGLSLYALVSLLGVANELFEVFLYYVGQMPHGIADTSYDLVANTLGAVLVHVSYLAVKGFRVVSSRD